MKQDFHNSKQIEQFRLALNSLVLAYCGVPDHYDLEAAAVELQELSKAWRKPTDYVFMTIVEEAQSALDARLINCMERSAKALNVPISTEKLRRSWKDLTRDEQIQLADTAIMRLQSMKREGTHG